MKFRKTALAVALSGVLLVSGCSQEAGETVFEEVFTAVEVFNVNPSEIKKEMVYAGQVAPVESVNVISKISGKVAEVHFDVGDRVSEGDVLFKLDEKDIRDQIRSLSATVSQSQASVDTARNSLNSVTGGKYQSEILSSESALEDLDKKIASAGITLQNTQIALNNAQLSLDNVTTSFENVKALYAVDAISKTDYDSAELGYNQALAAYQKAQNDYQAAENAIEQLENSKKTAVEALDLAKGQITDENRRTAELAVKTAEAARNSASVQLQLVQETLEDTAVTAPMSGVISVKNAKANEYVSSAAPAFVIVDIDKVNVEVRVSETLINTLYIGEEVDVYISSLGKDQDHMTGRVKTISPAADQTSTFPVSIEIDNPGGFIKPGMFAEIRFVKEESKNTIVLPRNAVLEDDANTYVYVNDNGQARRILVETGIDNGSHIEVVSGISAGDQVIVKGQTYVSDGEKINIVAAGEE